MLRFGEAPFLECSSKGDKRFSAFYARIKELDGKTIEELYQAYKIFSTSTGLVTGLSIAEAKGRKPINAEKCRDYYKYLWYLYINENEDLIKVLDQYNGFSDIFGQKGHACQAEEIYDIAMSLR